MIARSFRPVGWVATIGAAALGCYMLSLRVAAERADVDRLDARIVTASQNIRSLQTELGTRARMQQLEEWNDEVLALSAPVSGQYVEGGISLARFDVNQQPVAPNADVRLASADAAAPVTPAHAVTTPPVRAVATPTQTAPPMVRRASATLPAPAATTLPLTTPAPQPAATKPSTTVPTRTATIPARRPAATPARTAAAERTRPAAPTRPRAASLLDDRTMRDLNSTARSERGRATRN
jgi:hypothetical protein